MSNEYLIVDKKLLPKCFEKVIEAKKLLKENKFDSVSKVCDYLNISRSSFYKYQNSVYSYEERNDIKKIAVSLNLIHEKGSLSKICDKLAKFDISILTVFQSIPIDNVAPVMLSLDISNINISLNEFEKEMNKIPELSNFRIMSIGQ